MADHSGIATDVTWKATVGIYSIQRNCALVSFVVVALFACCGAAAAQTHCADRWTNEELHLGGTLGATEVRVYLRPGYPATDLDGVSGTFFFPRTWMPGTAGFSAEFSLDGTFSNDCQMQLKEIGSGPEGTWTLRFVTAQTLEGTRETASAGRQPISLHVVPETDCSGRGPWRTFSAAEWPVSFDYPASWQLARERSSYRPEVDDVIFLQCPDASRIAYGGQGIVLSLGRGSTSVQTEDDRHGTRIDHFVTFGGDQWQIDDHEGCETPESVFCEPARKSMWKGMKLLQGTAGEHRLYAPGGYVGQGPGIMSYLFLLGNQWVTIDSENYSDLIAQMGKPGPVLLQGNGVTERLVRSIRRR